MCAMNYKSLIFDLTNISSLDLHAQTAEAVTWQGHSALKLNGLALLLSLDGEQAYSGEHLWKDLPERKERGYVDIHYAQVTLEVPAGEHELVAQLGKKEYFGWGLIMKMGKG
jgi:hypothetical protein